MKYIENIVFFYGFNLKNIEFCSDFLPLKSSAHFSDEISRYFCCNNEKFIQNFFTFVKDVYPNYPIDDVKIQVSNDGFVNIQLIKDNFGVNIDTFDYEKAYAKFDNFLCNVFFKKYKRYFQQDKNILEIDFEYRYLFHQHTINKTKTDMEIKWSHYSYCEDKGSSIDILYIDTYIIEKNLLYMVYTQMFLHCMDDKNITLEKAREILINSRKKIAQHSFFFREFSTVSAEFIQNKKLFEKHSTPYSQKNYEKLDKDFENLTQNIENNRRETSASRLNKMILFLTALNVFSIILAFLSVMYSINKEIYFKIFDISSFIVSFFEVFFYCAAIAFMAVIVSAVFLVSIEIIKKFFSLLLKEIEC